MKEINSPDAQDWNNYWSLDNTKNQFTQISWSKKRIMKVLQEYLPDCKEVLDAGCGSGFFAEFFMRSGKQTTAMDYAPEALELTKQRTEGKVEVYQVDLLKDHVGASFAEQFDLIFTDGLFEHFTDEQQDKILQNFRTMLSPTGVIVTFVPNKFSPWELIRPFYMPGIEEDPFVLSQLIKMHERNQLSIDDANGLNTLPFRLSPDRLLGKYFGMLLYVIARKNRPTDS